MDSGLGTRIFEFCLMPDLTTSRSALNSEAKSYAYFLAFCPYLCCGRLGKDGWQQPLGTLAVEVVKLSLEVKAMGLC